MARSLNKGDLINLSGSSRVQPIDKFYESSSFIYFFYFWFCLCLSWLPKLQSFFFFWGCFIDPRWRNPHRGPPVGRCQDLAFLAGVLVLVDSIAPSLNFIGVSVQRDCFSVGFPAHTFQLSKLWTPNNYLPQLHMGVNHGKLSVFVSTKK